MRSKALLDLNVHPVHDAEAPWGFSRGADALLPSQKALLLDPYDLPLGCEPVGNVVCAYCAETGERVDDIHHQDWCIYLNGPVCPDVPN